MNIPEEMYGIVADTLRAEYDTAIEALESKQKANRWAVVYGLAPTADGDQWCVLVGDDLQSGIAAFGDTPEQAIENFDLAMRKPS